MNIGIDGRILDWKYSGIAKYVQLMLTFPFLKGATVYFPTKSSYQLPDGFHKKVINSPFRRRELYEQLILPFALAKDKIDLFIQPYNFGIPILFSGKSILLIFDLIPLLFKNYFFYAKIPRWARWNYEANTRLAISKAARIICDSAAARESLLTYFPKTKPSKVDYIYYGLQKLPVLNSFSYATLKKSKNISDEYLLANSGLEERKNTHLLIAAYGALKKKGLVLPQLIVTGYNPFYLKKLIKLVAKYSLEKEVVFTDSISEEEKNSLIKKAACLINVSQMEGFGIPLLEAAFFARPIICSDIAPYVEVGKDYPIYARQNDEQDLSEKIEFFLKNKDTETKRAKEKAGAMMNRFAYQTMCERWEQIIQGI